MRDATHLSKLNLAEEQRELLHPMKQTGRFELPVPAGE